MAVMDREAQAKQVAEIIFNDTFGMYGDDGIEYAKTLFSDEAGLGQIAEVLADYVGDNTEKMIDPRFLILGVNPGISVSVAEIQPALSKKITEYLALAVGDRAGYRARKNI